VCGSDTSRGSPKEEEDGARRCVRPLPPPGKKKKRKDNHRGLFRNGKGNKKKEHSTSAEELATARVKKKKKLEPFLRTLPVNNKRNHWGRGGKRVGRAVFSPKKKRGNMRTGFRQKEFHRQGMLKPPFLGKKGMVAK